MTEVRLGVDVGGTFTDVVGVVDGELVITKVPSTPAEPELGVVDGLEAARDRTDLDLTTVGFLAHGTTVATNAALEGTWADTALVTTEGFRDALEIGRQDRPALYDFHATKPIPIVERNRRFEVRERLDERGGVETPLDENVARAVAGTVAETDAESVAICLLFSFENDAHERQLASIFAEEAPGLPVSLSSRVLPEIREYERTLATALNAALVPVMDRYLGRLEDRVQQLGIPAGVAIMQSTGGLITAAAARSRPINALLSGPAAGVRGAAHLGDLAGLDDVLTLDMGGTSCDVAVVRGGEPVVTTEVEVGDYPVGVPSVDVHTIGAGGGSIGWIDAGDALRVGPESAGAEPGPICYGRGGDRPTVTDAHYLLGRIDPAQFVADLAVDDAAVEAGFETHLTDGLDGDAEEAAAGMLEVANANMARALRVVSVERGHDPRSFGLVAFGGAGPLHAAALADTVGIPRVIVPRTAGVLSALGLLIGDVRYDYSRTTIRPWDAIDPNALTAQYASLEEEATAQLANEGVDPADRRLERSAELRYAGQSFELAVPVPGGPLDAADLETLAARFHDRHEERYGHASPEEPVELVTVRLRALGATDLPDLAADAGGSIDAAARGARPAAFGGAWHDTPVYDRAKLPTNASLDGPAIVEGSESTTVLPPGTRAEVDRYANLVISVGGS